MTETGSAGRSDREGDDDRERGGTEHRRGDADDAGGTRVHRALAGPEGSVQLVVVSAGPDEQPGAEVVLFSYCMMKGYSYKTRTQ